MNSNPEKTMKNRLTKKQKIGLLAASPECIGAVKLMLACMYDVKSKNFISMEYSFGDLSFELKLTKLK